MDISEAGFLSRIRSEFPHLKWTSHAYIGSGFDHAVLILDGQIVFRAPRASSGEQQLADEIRLLDHLRPLLPVHIPNYQYIAADGSFAGYACVPGTELHPGLFVQLSPAERNSVAAQLAGFLRALHAVPRSVAREHGTPDNTPQESFAGLSRKVEEHLAPRLSEPEMQRIRLFLSELEALPGPACDSVLIHRDLAWEHIFWDAATRSVGIIDFSDRAWGDPALDFAGLMWYGEDFVRQVYSLYGNSWDENLLRRARLYSLRVPLFLMVDSLDGLPCSYDEGYQLFRQRFSYLLPED